MKTIGNVKALSQVPPDGIGRKYLYWSMNQSRLGYIVGDLGLVSRLDVEHKRIAVRERKENGLWYVLDSKMHTAQYYNALEIIRQDAEGNL